MANVLITSKDLKDLYANYTGFDAVKVGAGLANPDIYATKAYSKTKVKDLLLGVLAKVNYIAHQYDPQPLILPIKHESAYNTILAMNLHYVGLRQRTNILKVLLDANNARIKSNLPIMVDIETITRMIPESKYIIRRYKQILIGMGQDGGSIPLTEWENVIQEKSKWESHWRDVKTGRIKPE